MELIENPKNMNYSEPTRAEVLNSCSKFQTTNNNLIILWSLSFILIVSFYRFFIVSNKIKLQIWIKVILFGHMTVLILWIVGDVLANYVQDKTFIYFKDMISIFFKTTLDFLYLLFGFKMMIIEAQMSSFQSSIEKVVRRIKRVIFFQRLSVIFFIFYQIFKIIISFIRRKIDSFGDSFELFLLWTLMF